MSYYLISAKGKRVREGERNEEYGIEISVLNGMIKEGLTQQVTFKQNSKGKEEKPCIIAQYLRAQPLQAEDLQCLMYSRKIKKF